MVKRELKDQLILFHEILHLSPCAKKHLNYLINTMIFNRLKLSNSCTSNIIDIDSENTFESSKISIQGSNNTVKIGKFLKIKNLTINLKGDNKQIIIEPSSRIINNLKLVSIRANNQKIKIGENFDCGGVEVQMNDGNENLIIGDDCMFSWGIKIRTSDGHSVIDLDTNKAINLPRDVTIGNRAWIGEDVSILKGVKILDDCVIGSRSVLTKVFKEGNCVIAGYPAEIVKRNIKWNRQKPDLYNARNS